MSEQPPVNEEERQKSIERLKELRKNQEINVTIDNVQMQKMAQDLAEERLKNKNLESKIKKVDLVLDKALEDKLDKLHITEPEERQFYKDNPNLLTTRARAGSAPLNDKQLGRGEQFKFNNYATMVEFLKAHLDDIVTGSLTGREVLHELWKSQVVPSMKSGQQLEGINPNPEVPSKDTQSPIEVALTPNMKATEKSEIRKALDYADELARERIRIARKRMVAKGNEK